MRVLLISSNTSETPYPVYPIGCSMVAAALSNAGHEVWQFDFLQQQNSFAAVTQVIKEFDPELIGVSIRNIDNVNILNEQCYLEAVKNIVRQVRELTPAVVILGGPGFSLVPELILDEIGADYGIIGEGELLMVDFTNAAARGIYPHERLIGPDSNLSGTDIPSGKYDEKLMEYYLAKSSIASVQTKRGCTQSCVYCTYPILEGHKIRPRDPGLVVDDIELLYKHYKAKYIFFVDSVFNDDEGVYINVLEEMRRRKVVVPWMAFFKPAGLNDEIVEFMKHTGLVAAEFGSDSPTDIGLNKMGKTFCFDDIVKSNSLMLKHGISASHYFMFGGPGETEETVLEGIENIKALNGCVMVIFMGIRILPNTALADIAVAEGIISAADGLLESAYYISPSIDREWLAKTLTHAFAGIRRCIFPPDTYDKTVRMLYELGCSGPLWDKLI